MLRLFWKLYWKLSGWKIKGSFPYQHKKMVIIVAPHTSWKDLVNGFAARSVLGVGHARFLGKKELFAGPFGWLFRWLGGTPVDRSGSNGVVEQVVHLFESNQVLLLGLSPEGTRKRVDKLRTGFYHIAKKAKVPVLPIGMDYSNKQLVLGEVLFPGENEESDYRKIIHFFSACQGRKPALDLRHLREEAVP